MSKDSAYGIYKAIEHFAKNITATMVDIKRTDDSEEIRLLNIQLESQKAELFKLFKQLDHEPNRKVMKRA